MIKLVSGRVKNAKIRKLFNWSKGRSELIFIQIERSVN